jgi:uncharacterized secreted protein with C-terminal beta-propeller domain
MTTRRGRAVVAVGITGLVALAGCSGSETISGSPPPVDLGDVRLIAYDSCDGLLDWFHQEAAARVTAYGLDTGNGSLMATRGAAEFDQGSGSSSASAADSSASAPTTASGGDGGTSTTNTQEQGVGEPDLAWTDGTRLVTVEGGVLRVVDLDAGAVTATLDLPDSETGSTPVGLLVDGDHALVVQRSYGVITYDTPSSTRGGDVSSMPVQSAPGTRLTRVDLGATPTIIGSVSVDGDYVDARMVDGVVRAVVRSSPAQLGFVYPAGNGQAAIDRAAAANRQVIAESTISDWLPTMTVETAGQDGTTTPAVDCSAVDHPTVFGGFGVVTVVGLDLAAGAVEPLPSAAVVADAQTVYASTEALYLATTRWPSYAMTTDGVAPTTSTPAEEQQIRTDVHAFSLPADVAARYEASGSVPGQLLGQFALSEHDGDLRVASTTTPSWFPEPMPMAVEDDASGSSSSGGVAVAPVTEPAVSESRITVLRRDGEALGAVGEVTGLGPTEQIRGVRFAGPTAYVVTFRQTDPLFVVDLSDPEAPRVAGELKIPGYSSYLQEIGEGRVIGIGQDATTTGRQTGFQQTLFDVSDPSSPQRLAQLVVPYAQSSAESDHHALLWWAPEGLLAVPVTNWPLPSGATGAGILVTRITDRGIEQVGTVVHPSTSGDGGTVPSCPPNANCILPVEPSYAYPTQIDRTLVANGRLVTVSTAGVKVSDLSTLADRAWIPFI